MYGTLSFLYFPSKFILPLRRHSCIFSNSRLVFCKPNVGSGPTVITGKSSNETIASDEDAPMETQNAQCTIKAGNIEASAQASVSKKLEGICGTSKYN